jgi:DNA-binding beta-propeller fold protein YncE
MQRKHLAAVAAAVALAGTALSAPAVAADPSAKPKASTLAKGLVSPLSLAVSDDGTVYYAQNFAGTLHAKKPGKPAKTIYTAPVPGTEVGAVSERQGSLRFALTLPPASEEVPPQTVLMGVGGNGKAKPLADLSKHEETKNPDGKVVYGIRSLPDGCEVPPMLGSYPGIVESHPYATTQVNGATFVADAAGNTILKLGKNGKLSTLAVLPAQPLKITAAVAEVLAEMEVEVPECAIDSTMYLEPVPTDVERGPDGKLYVTTLPGGPEDPRLGARGAVYRVDPKTGRTTKVAGGLLSPTGVAVDARGTVFVAELFGGRIAKIKKGAKTPSGFFKTLMPGDVEVRKNGDLYATNQALIGDETTPPGGQVIRIKR